MTGSDLIHLCHRRMSPHRYILFVAPLGSAISCWSGPVMLLVRYTMPDIHCRDRRYKCNGGISPGIVLCYRELAILCGDSIYCGYQVT